MNADTSDMLWRWATSPAANTPLQSSQAREVRAAFNSAGLNEKLWRASVEHAQTQLSKIASKVAAPSDVWAPARALIAVGLSLSRIKGLRDEGPLGSLVEAGRFGVARSALALMPAEEINRKWGEDHTLITTVAERIGSGRVGGEEGVSGGLLVAEIARHPAFDPIFRDQGARALFALQGAALHWSVGGRGRGPSTKQIIAADCDRALKAQQELTRALLHSGVDLNAARLGKGVNIGSPICTALAYLMKRVHQWDAVAGILSDPARKALADGLAQDLLDLGANPGLQIESQEKNALMGICREGRWGERLAALIERSLLREELGLGVGSAPGSRAPATGVGTLAQGENTAPETAPPTRRSKRL